MLILALRRHYQPLTLNSPRTCFGIVGIGLVTSGIYKTNFSLALITRIQARRRLNSRSAQPRELSILYVLIINTTYYGPAVKPCRSPDRVFGLDCGNLKRVIP